MKMNRRIVVFAQFVWVFLVLHVPVLVFGQQADKKSASAATPAPPPTDAAATLEEDWLYQAEGKPLAERTIQEIQWTREIAARMGKLTGAPDLRVELTQLTELEARSQPRLAPDDPATRQRYLAVRSLKRRIMFKNPAIDFTQVLFIDQPMPHGGEWDHQAQHRNGRMATAGGRLMILDGLNPGGKLR